MFVAMSRSGGQLSRGLSRPVVSRVVPCHDRAAELSRPVVLFAVSRSGGRVVSATFPNKFQFLSRPAFLKNSNFDINLLKRLSFITKSGTVLDTFQKSTKSVSKELRSGAAGRPPQNRDGPVSFSKKFQFRHKLAETPIFHN